MRSENGKNRLAAVLSLAVASTPLLYPGLAAADPAPTVESGTGGENARVVGRASGGALSASVTVRSFHWGSTLTPAPLGGGGGVGKPTFADLTFGKAIDSNSPALMGALAAGLHFPTMTLEVFAAGSTNVLVKYELTGVLVVGLTNGDRGRSNGGQPLEEVSLTYSRIQTTVGAVTVCYDIARAARC